MLTFCKIIVFCELQFLGFFSVASPDKTQHVWVDFKTSYTTAFYAYRILGLIREGVISSVGRTQFLGLENLIDCNLSWSDDYFHCCVKQIELLDFVAHEISVGI